MIARFLPHWPRDALRAATIAMLTVVVFFPAFLAFNWATSSTDDALLRERIVSAFESGALVTGYGPENDRQIGAANYNDCVVLVMAANGHGSPLERALSPAGRLPQEGYRMADGVEPVQLCDRLYDIVVLGNEEAYDFSPYHRYFHGTRALAELATPIIGVHDYREALMIANKAAIVLALFLALRMALANDRDIGGLAIAIAIFVFYTFGGFEFFSMSLSFGPADFAVYATLIALLANGVLQGSFQRHLWICAIGGAAVIYFEFLTGQLPIAILMLIALPALALRRDEDAPEAARRAVFGVAVFAAVAIALMACKYAATYAVFGDAALEDILGQLDRRTSAGEFSLLDLIMRLAYRSHHLLWGSTALGVAFTAFVIVAVGLALRAEWNALRQSALPVWRRWRAVLILLAFASVAVWYLAFFSHSAIHAIFMVRPLGALYGVGLAYATLVWFETREERPAAAPSRS